MELLEYLCRNFKGDIHVSLGMTRLQEEQGLIEVFRKNKRLNSKVVIATDDDRIKTVVGSMNLPKVCVFECDTENATDTAGTESVMLEFISKLNLNPDDNIFLIQATSPLLKADMIDDMFQKFIQSGKDSALSAVRNKRFFLE